MSDSPLEQQVNLFEPIMGAQKRLFSARAIAFALTVLLVSLLGLAGFGSWRTQRIERSIAQLARQETASMELAGRAGAVLRPKQSLPELDAEAKELSADIAARERALEVVRRGSATASTGFAARLEALARRQPDGLWLKRIVLGSGEGQLAMRGAALETRLVPEYLSALAHERALAGVRFDKLAMRRADSEQTPARLLFELDGPGLEAGNGDKPK